MAQRGEVERDGRRDALDDRLLERDEHALDGLGAVLATRDHLGDQRVVVRGHRVAGIDVGVDPDARPARLVPVGDLARAGPEVVGGILGVDAALDRVAAELDLLLRQRQLPAGGDADLLLHQVDARDHLGHRVLDLDARVHLHEVERAVLVQQELDRPHGVVADRRGALDRQRADPGPRSRA